MIELEIFKNFFLAIALGALIGLEREYAKFHKRGHTYAGIRTFPLIALSGALAAFLGQVISVWILYIMMIIVGLLIVVAYFVLSQNDPANSGATSEMAGFLTFFIGMFAFYGEFTFAVSMAVIITLILYLRSMLHHFAQKITQKEMLDTIVFILIAFVILPFLPNKWYGPLDVFNPQVLWLMVVLISGISFFGYALMKWFGEKGIGLAGVLGGLISSTAVTMGFSERSKRQKKIFQSLALGVIAANGIMFIRILVELFAINRPLFFQMLLPLLSLATVSALFSYFLWKKIKKVRNVKGKMDLGSPLKLLPAVKFGVFFAIIIALIKVAEFYFSAKGVYVVSFISGLADVDAITVSLAQLANSTVSLQVASRGIMLAALTNVAVKGGMAYWFGGKDFRKIVVGLFAILIVLGSGLMFLL
jgi:uncharacterized membrane protein (DUF4010 family)